MAALLLGTGAMAAPGKGGDKPQPVGAAARAKHGPDPMAAPPSDVGMAEDPEPVNAQAAPPAAPPQAPARTGKPKG